MESKILFGILVVLAILTIVCGCKGISNFTGDVVRAVQLQDDSAAMLASDDQKRALLATEQQRSVIREAENAKLISTADKQNVMILNQLSPLNKEIQQPTLQLSKLSSQSAISNEMPEIRMIRNLEKDINFFRQIEKMNDENKDRIELLKNDVNFMNNCRLITESSQNKNHINMMRQEIQKIQTLANDRDVRLSDLRNQNLSEIATLRSENQRNQAEVAMLRTEMQKLQSANVQHEATRARLSSEIESLRSRNNMINQQIARLTSENNSMRQQLMRNNKRG